MHSRRFSMRQGGIQARGQTIIYIPSVMARQIAKQVTVHHLFADCSRISRGQ